MRVAFDKSVPLKLAALAPESVAPKDRHGMEKAAEISVIIEYDCSHPNMTCYFTSLLMDIY